MIRTQVTFTPEQTQLLKEAAYHKDLSMAEVVRRAVDDAFGANTKRKSSNEKNIGTRLMKTAQNARRRGVKGPKDLSANTDHYLYGTPKKK